MTAGDNSVSGGPSKLPQAAEASQAQPGTRSVFHAMESEPQKERGRRVEELWRRLDPQGARELDLKGLQKGLRRIDHPMKNADEMLREIINIVDVNGDGKIQFEEFRVFVEAAERQLLFLFRSIDRDHDGRLNKDELRAAFQRGGLAVPSRRLNGFFDEIDMNHDGYITFDEWRDFLLFVPTKGSSSPLEAALSYYASIVVLNAEGDSMVSDETLEGLGTTSGFLLQTLFGSIMKLAKPNAAAGPRPEEKPELRGVEGQTGLDGPEEQEQNERNERSEQESQQRIRRRRRPPLAQTQTSDAAEPIPPVPSSPAPPSPPPPPLPPDRADASTHTEGAGVAAAAAAVAEPALAPAAAASTGSGRSRAAARKAVASTTPSRSTESTGRGYEYENLEDLDDVDEWDEVLSTNGYEGGGGGGGTKLQTAAGRTQSFKLTQYMPHPGYFLAGALAGGISRTATAPFDRLKVYLLVSTHGGASAAAAAVKSAPPLAAVRSTSWPIKEAIVSLYRAGGLRTFFAGNGLNVVKIMPETAIKFGSYEAAKRAFATLEGHGDPTHINPYSKFVAGGVAGMVAQFFVYPLDTLKFRLQCETVPGGPTGRALVLQTARKMFADSGGGLRTAYRGVTMGLIGMFPYSAIDMGTFELLKTTFTRYKARYYGLHEEDVVPGNVVTGVIGATSGAFGATVVYPLNVLRTRLQTQGTAMHPATYTGIWDVASRTLANEGVRGLYKGLTPNLLKVAPALSITWVVYENSKRMLGLP